MALSNLDKDTVFRLLESINKNDTFDIEIIKKNYSVYSKLELISEQIFNLMIKAEEIIDQSKINERLSMIPVNFKKIPGNFYYHYIINENEILSIISPDEWDIYDKFLGKYLYNFDNIFYLQ